MLIISILRYFLVREAWAVSSRVRSAPYSLYIV